MLPNLNIEKRLLPLSVAGIDEAGRGPLVGPVVAAAVIIDDKYPVEGINDSKKLSFNKRVMLYELITSKYKWGIGIISNQEIDEINIAEATKKACLMAARELSAEADLFIVDGNMKFPGQNFLSIVKGDNISMSIAAASIVAKVTRDRMMINFAKIFPGYGWDRNFGYGTRSHIEAIRIFGATPLHRKSFKVKSLLNNIV